MCDKKNNDTSSISYVRNNTTDLIYVLANRKKFIFLVISIFAIIGIIISNVLPEKWIGIAVIAPPGNEQMLVLDEVTNSLAVLDVDLDITPAYLLSNFMQYFNSQDIREQYIVNTDYFKSLIGEDKENDFNRRESIDSLVKSSIGVVSITTNNPDGEYKLSYSSITPTDAHNLLQGYINYVEAIVSADINLKIQRAVDSAKNMMRDRYLLELLRAKNSQEVKVELLKQAYLIAEKTGIKKTLYTSGAVVSNNPDFLILMGSNVLSNKIEIEESITDLTLTNASLLNHKLYLDKLNALVIPKVSVVPFKYLQRPTEPTKKDAPKRSLIIILFSLFGLFSAVCFVLTGHFIRKHEDEMLKIAHKK